MILKLGRPELREGGREEVGQGAVGKSSSRKPGICKGKAEHGECRNWPLPCVAGDTVMQDQRGEGVRKRQGQGDGKVRNWRDEGPWKPQ